MIPALKSELRKIYTIRSTYIILLVSLLIMGIFAFWVEGYKAGINSSAVTNPDKLAKLLGDAMTNLAGLGALVGLLSITHEYRYNTITYTLTSSRNRGRVLLSKVLAISIFAVLFSVFVSVFASLMMYIGISLQGSSLVHQAVPIDLGWRILFVGWGFSMVALIISFLVRNQVGAIVAFLFIPDIIEALLGLLLKDNAIYLPYTALQQVTGLMGADFKHLLSHGEAALVFMVYLAVGFMVTWYLFLKRDAS